MSLFISILFQNVAIICYLLGMNLPPLYASLLTQSLSLSAIRGSCRQEVAVALGRLSDHDSTEKYILQWKAYVSEDLTIERSQT